MMVVKALAFAMGCTRASNGPFARAGGGTDVCYRALAGVARMADAPDMRCFYVLVHGKLDWTSDFSESDESAMTRPVGFYCHRYVLASCEEEAREKAFRRVRHNLNKQTKWLAEGLASLNLETEKTTLAPMHKLLRTENRGHTFYDQD